MIQATITLKCRSSQDLAALLGEVTRQLIVEMNLEEELASTDRVTQTGEDEAGSYAFEVKHI